MKNSFSDLGIIPPILKALQEMGFEAPTEIQQMAIPSVLKQEDLIVRSKTGSGKTAVFGVPLLQLTDPQAGGIQCLILTPTRELAVQIDNELKLIAKHLPHKTTAVYGQHNMNLELQELRQGVTFVTGTPGRVYDHIEHGSLNTKNIRYLVLDEADRMLDMGFLDQVERIIKTLPVNRGTLLFSATIPTEIHSISRKYMKNPGSIEIESSTMVVDTTQQLYYRVKPNEKRTQLNRLLLYEQPESCIIFCNTRNSVNRIQDFLSQKGYNSQALHGDIPQVKRLRTLQQFKQGEFSILIATDVASRGIHIDSLSLVINYDIPIEKDGYVHRIGRTGRAGNGGRAISLVTADDIMSLYEIEEHIGVLIEEAELPTDNFFRENRASIDAWIKSKSRPRTPRIVPDSLRQTAQKRSSSRQKNKPQAAKVNKPPATGGSKTQTAGSRPQTANINKVTATGVNHSNKSERVKTSYPSQPERNVKPVANHTIRTPQDAEPVKVKPVVTPLPADTTSSGKMSFLKRLIKQVWNR